MAENKTTTPAIATRVDRSASTRSSDDQKVAGRITITDGVVAKVAGIAAREVTACTRSAAAEHARSARSVMR